MFDALYFIQMFALTSPFIFALTSTVLLSQTLVLNHVFVDLCLQFLYNHLHLRPFYIDLRRFLLSLSFDLLGLLKNTHYELISFFFIIYFLLAFLFSSASFGFFELYFELLFFFLQLFYLVFKIEDAQV